jgi:hypothetical protein
MSGSVNAGGDALFSRRQRSLAAATMKHDAGRIPSGQSSAVEGRQGIEQGARDSFPLILLRFTHVDQENAARSKELRNIGRREHLYCGVIHVGASLWQLG